MKLLVVGSDKIYAIENFYVKYIREAGVEVLQFPAQTIFYDHYQKNIFNKLLFKAGMSSILNKINKEFIAAVTAFGPDVILVFKGMEIFAGSLRWAKQKGIRLVNYNPDNPFIFSGTGSGNRHVKESIPLYDLHLTYNSAVQKRMLAAYKIPTAIIPFGFDISDKLFEKCLAEPEVLKACFLGNPDTYRGDFLMQLAERGIEIDVYGNCWSKFVKHANITVFQPVTGDDLWLVLRKYRVQLNLMRPHNPDTHNMRSFEIPGVGGIQLAPDTPDHRSYFKPGEEIFLYTNVDDCAQQVRHILSLPVNDAMQIRAAARERSIASGYTYRDKALAVLDLIRSPDA